MTESGRQGEEENRGDPFASVPATVPVRQRRPGEAPPAPGEQRSGGGRAPRRRPRGAQNRSEADNLPEAGDELFGYRLHRELGRGAFARAFLAEETLLSGRPVVLKVSALEGAEPQTLAQMQHSHIVPIYSLHENSVAGLRAVCMPYFGGATLAQVLRALWATGRPRHGSELAAALAEVQSPPPRGHQAQGIGPTGALTALGRFRALAYCRCAAWIVARLAEGLQHAHDRGVLHRDIKPSNILLGADGVPLLLDFNVAQWQQGEEESMVGGTSAYAAPEHLHAMAAPTPERVSQVDRRSDVYALGVVLYELLTGSLPFEERAGYSDSSASLVERARDRFLTPVSPRQRRPDLPWTLESIVRRCLAPDPAQRYQQAEHLADDLRRFLDDRPLRHAPELSKIERLRKCLRRHPRLTSSASVALFSTVLLLGAAAAFVGVRRQLNEVQARDVQKAYEAGALRALCLVNTVTDLDDHLVQGAQVCEATLGLYGVLDRDDWQEDPRWQRLAPEERRRLAANTRELLQLLAWARTRAAPGDHSVLRQALALLDRAEALSILPPSRALRTDRAAYLAQLGETTAAARVQTEAEAIEPAGAQDHYLLATVHARQGGRAGWQRAVADLDRALRLNPQHYWALMQRGICRQELGEPLLAATDFSTCAGLWPDAPWAYFNRGYVLAQAGKRAEAVDDFTTALEHDPDFTPAYVNRGLVQLELQRHAPALADFDRALDLGRDDAFLHASRGIALEALRRHEDADQAFAAGFARARLLPASARARIHCSHAFAISQRRPDRARAAFDAILRDDPHHAQALYGRAMLATANGRLDDALAFADRAVAANPGWVDARRCRAIILARRGELARAAADINGCLERAPRDGPTLYAAACVAAHSPAASDQAFDLLQRAFDEDYGRDRAGADPDLAAVRRDPRFRAMISTPADSSGK